YVRSVASETTQEQGSIDDVFQLDQPAKGMRLQQGSVVSEATDTTWSPSIVKLWLVDCDGLSGHSPGALRAVPANEDAPDATKRHPGPRRMRREQAEAARNVRAVAVARLSQAQPDREG